MFKSYQIPYPTHKSPLDGDTAHRDLDWFKASQTDTTFVYPIGRSGITRQSKLSLLQTQFWPALTRWVDFRQEVLPGGTIVGGWWRADMLGMMDWYRDCFQMTARWEDAVVAHSDGVWRAVLETSPWRNWPEFFNLLKEPVLEADGRPKRDASGRVLYRDKDPRVEGMEDAFIDIWEEVANRRPLDVKLRRPNVMPTNQALVAAV